MLEVNGVMPIPERRRVWYANFFRKIDITVCWVMAFFCSNTLDTFMVYGKHAISHAVTSNGQDLSVPGRQAQLNLEAGGKGVFRAVCSIF